MTVSTTLNKIIYSGNGSTTVFPFTFPGVAASDIQVFYTDALGNITLLSTSTYTLILTAATGTNPTGAGGSVTYNPLGVPIPTGSFLTIMRTLPLTQATSLANQGTLYQPVEEAALDYQMMVSQQVLEIQSRALVVPVSDPTPSALPAVAARKLLFLAFDSSGNPIASTPSGASSPVSSAMAPVVAAATLSAGRTAFGLGAMAVEGIGAGLQDDGAGNARVNFSIAVDSIAQSVVAGFDLTRRQVAAAITYTFPLSSTLFGGFGFWIQTNGFAVTLAINAADTFNGGTTGQSLILPPGQTVFIQTNATGTWYVDYGAPIGLNAPNNLVIAASVASNALTIALKDRNGNDPTPTSPIILEIASGVSTPTTLAITAPLSIVVPTSATLGTVSGQANRIWIGLFNNAGTPVLGVYNSLNSTGPTILSWDESTAVAGTAISAGATSSQTWYTNGSVASHSFRIIGYVESTQATAGTWATSPSKVQLFGPANRKPGDIVQTVGTISTANPTTTSSTFVALTGITVAITPTSAANLIKAESNGTAQSGASAFIQTQMSRGAVAATNLIGNVSGGSTNISCVNTAWDIPNTTSSTTYALQARLPGGVTLTWNPNTAGVAQSFMSAMEIFI